MKRLLMTLMLATLCACAGDDDVETGADAAAGDGGAGLADGSVKFDSIPGADAAANDAGVIFTPDVAPLPCQVNIRSVTTPDLTNLPAGPGLFVRLRGEVVGQPRPLALNWQWQVSRGGVSIAPEATSGDASLIKVPLEQAGNYAVSVSVGDGCVGEARLTAEATDTLTKSVFLRVIPPATSNAPAKDDAVRIRAGTNATANLVLTEGAVAQITPTRLLGGQKVLAPSVIRISSSTSSFLQEGAATASSPFKPVLNLGGFDAFDLLIVPEEIGLPPLLIARQAPSTLRNLEVPLSPGVRVAGKITRDGTAIVGARLLLRKDQQPSTIGESDPAGAYVLRARPGMHSVRLVPPANASWPTLELPASAGLSLPTEGADVTVNIDYADSPTATLTLTINKPDGSGPAAFTLVDLLSAPQANAATMTVGASAPVSVPGFVTVTAVADAAGQVVVRDLARSVYTVKLRRPSAAAWSSAHQTTINVDLRGGNGADTVKLSPALMVSGTINVVGGIPAGLRVVAVNLEDKTGAPEATGAVTAQGAFVLNVSPQASYRLRVDPPLGTLYPRVVLGSISTENSDKRLDVKLPKTVRLTGKVSNSTGQSVPGTIVQAYCSDLSDDCIDNSRTNVGVALPLSEAVTDSSGTFVLVLPDPGSI